MSPSAFVIDPAFLVREGYRHIFESSEEITCTGAATEPEEALQMLSEFSPDVIITEIMFDREFTPDIILQLKTLQKDCPVLVVSLLENTHVVVQALKAGADGYLVKREAGRELLPTIRKLINGELVLSSSLNQSKIQSHLDRSE